MYYIYTSVNNQNFYFFPRKTMLFSYLSSKNTELLKNVYSDILLKIQRSKIEEYLNNNL